MDPASVPTSAQTHICNHCQVPLKVDRTRPQPPFRIPFPHTVNEAKVAAQDGCLIFKELVSAYSCRSLWMLMKSHILNECKCCNGTWQWLQYIMKSLTSQPFQLLFLEHLHKSGPVPTWDSLVHLDCGNGPIGRHFNVYTYTGNNAASLVPSFDMEIGKSHTIESVQKWLQHCRCRRESSEQIRFKPTRVLDLGDTERQDHVRLIKTLGTAITSYACLSYCWGGSQSVVNTIQRDRSSDGSIIALHELPETFKDAIYTLRRLGLRYLWIDSLCIIQDNPDDKEREIHQMANIYKNSELTLCASSARSCHTGFLQPRPNFSANQLQFSMPTGQSGTIYLDRVLWSFPPVREPLGTRAWAFQEWMLSPRLLEYGWRTVRWSCFCCERYSGYQDLPASTERYGGTGTARSYNLFGYLNPLGIRRMAQRREELFACWVRIIHRYTRLDLTLPDDRLVAIGGVAAELEERTNVRYLAGLWDYEMLPLMLLWKVELTLRKLHPRPTKTSRAPSWSWAAVDDAVSVHNSREQIQLFKVLKTDVYGGFSLSAHGTITIEGPVRSASSLYEKWDFTEDLVDPDSTTLSMRDYELIIWPDCAGELFQTLDDTVLYQFSDLTFLAIGRANWDHDIVRGLILIPQRGRNHKRAGLFQARSKGSFLVTDWSVEVLCIE